MSPLRQVLADYLTVRRALRSKLDRAEKLLDQFIAYLEDHEAPTVTVDHALAWATLSTHASPWWWAMRMSPVRGFATYLRTIDGLAEIPPAGIIAHGRHRATPYLYSSTDISALTSAAASLSNQVRATTYPALVGVLAATGMRLGEAVALDVQDFDPDDGVLIVREGKFGKSRLLPLHPTTAAGLRQYVRVRNSLPVAISDALFVSTVGTRLDHSRVHKTFKKLTHIAGLTPRSAECRPRIHDLRHSFAVATLLDWYRRGDDVPALLPRLSTYLGHTDPKHTYWYLSAAPELLALAADRLQTHLAGQP
jgi:integrase